MDLKKLIKEVITKRNLDCGCGCDDICAKAPILNENLQSRILMTENMQYHIDNKKPLTDNTFRYGSKAFLDLWVEARYLYSRNAIDAYGLDKEIITETRLGEYGMFEGQLVPLDMPILEEVKSKEEKELEKLKKDLKALDKKDTKTRIAILQSIKKLTRQLELVNEGKLDEAEYHGKKVQIGKPKRGGASGKKFYVYVMDKGKVKKVSFGDSGGLSTKINDPKARHAYAARHKCAQAKDRTKAGYWSCNIGRYWKSLGGSKNFSGYW